MSNDFWNSIDIKIRPLLRQVSRGEVVLFLGAGVNKGSLNSNRDDAPLGNQLAAKLKSQFLPDDELPDSLPIICDVIESRTSRPTLEQYIYELLIDYEPSEVLKLIPYGRWRSIYTTNFDRLIEQAYEQEEGRVQRLHTFYSDRDKFDFNPNTEVPYFKLHGCITKISTDTRLILTARDYARYRDNRQRLFNRLHDDLRDHTILFVGYSLSDPNFSEQFYEIQTEVEIRDFPQCYAISPGVPPAIVETWDKRKVAILDYTAADFFDLANQVPIEANAIHGTEELYEEINTLNAQLSRKLDFDLADNLFRSFTKLNNSIGYEGVKYEQFYQGNPPTWAHIKNDCDAKRTITERILYEIILPEELDRLERFECVVITAEAGAGKTTVLMRLAYEHATKFDGFCLFHRSRLDIPIDALEEIIRIKKQRIFIYLDDAADNINSLSALVKRGIALHLPITVICAERRNEWNEKKERLLPLVPAEYELSQLDDQEIDDVLQVLEKNNYLCELASKSIDERRLIFKEKAGKQLLVAMREATEGKDFDRIIEDEYQHIPSDLARKTYLYICALHRFGIPVRAGLLKRLSGVPFSDFEEKLLGPCELVIHMEENYMGDTLYRARHPHIAEIVCKHALEDKQQMTTLYMEVLNKMDIAYASDRYAFRRLIRISSPSVAETIPGIERKRYFYDRALQISGNESEVHHQYGLMELRFGEPESAEFHLNTALRMEPTNSAYQHSYANHLFQKAKETSHPEKAARYMRDARKQLGDLIRTIPTNNFAYNTFADTLIYSAQRATEASTKQEMLQEAHELILTGLRKCVDKARLLATQAAILKALGDDAKATQSLVESHKTDAGNVRVALLLGKWLMKEGKYADALEVVTTTLKFHEDNENLNKLCAQLLQDTNSSDHTKIISILRRIYDRDYKDVETNFALGLEYFRAGQFDDADEIFRGFQARRHLGIDGFYDISDVIKDDNGVNKQFNGDIVNLFDVYGRVSVDLLRVKAIYFQRTGKSNWRVGARVRFNIGFNLMGPIAINLQIATPRS